jgi:hypothetical protein
VNDRSRGSILVCEECGQRTVLDGPLSAWCSGSTAFGCRCGEGKPTAAVPLKQEHQGHSGCFEPRIGGGEP